MKFRKDEALVLHGRRWSESSIILTCLSREYGRVTVVSKGARRPKSFVGSYHVPGSQVELVWIDNKQSDLYSLVSIDSIVPVSVPADYQRFTAWMRALKLVKRTTSPESPHPTGFVQTIRTLAAIASTKTDAQLLFIQFVLRWVSELGFPLDWSRCDRCGNAVRGAKVALIIERGVGICETCHTQKYVPNAEIEHSLSGEAFAWLRRLEAMSEREVKGIAVSERAREEMETVCSLYVEHHLGISMRTSFH